MRSRHWAAALAAAFSFCAAGVASADTTQVGPLGGVWRNPKNSIHVDIKACGPAICGYVVWATPKAEADVAKAGNKLIGLQLLRDFTLKGDLYRGKVFVPDLNATFSGTAEMIDVNTMRAKGCLLPGIACKSQIWRRVEGGVG